MTTIRISLCFTALLTLVSNTSRANSCYQGYDSTQCIQNAVKAEAEMKALYAAEEHLILKRFDSYEESHKEEVIRSLRALNTAHAAYKDAECIAVPLRDGMSLKDSGVLADECKLNWRRTRVFELRKRGITPR